MRTEFAIEMMAEEIFKKDIEKLKKEFSKGAYNSLIYGEEGYYIDKDTVRCLDQVELQEIKEKWELKNK